LRGIRGGPIRKETRRHKRLRYCQTPALKATFKGSQRNAGLKGAPSMLGGKRGKGKKMDERLNLEDERLGESEVYAESLLREAQDS